MTIKAELDYGELRGYARPRGFPLLMTANDGLCLWLLFVQFSLHFQRSPAPPPSCSAPQCTPSPCHPVWTLPKRCSPVWTGSAPEWPPCRPRRLVREKRKHVQWWWKLKQCCSERKRKLLASTCVLVSSMGCLHHWSVPSSGYSSSHGDQCN